MGNRICVVRGWVQTCDYVCARMFASVLVTVFVWFVDGCRRVIIFVHVCLGARACRDSSVHIGMEQCKWAHQWSDAEYVNSACVKASIYRWN